MLTDFDVKERVRNASDIVDVIGRDLELRPQGRNFVARCPFHNDKRPSMTVNPDRQSWKCWVCDIGGDVFSFVMQREGLDFPAALRLLAERAGIEIPEFRPGPKTQFGSPDDPPTLLAAVEAVAQAYFRELEQGKSDDARLARDYLAGRGVDDDHRKRFRIGFAPDQWDFATNLLKAEGFSEKVAQACGVAIARDGGGTRHASGCYDRFRGRLMFPICNPQGKTISLGGRIIPQIADRIAAASSDSRGGAKYINGPETKLYRKSNELYGLDLARDAIRNAGEVLVMEGYTDVVAASMAGISNAVAVLGTALTAAHIRVLKRFASRVVLVLDGDEAGRRRAEEVLELFVTADADLRILTLPDNADPDDFLRQHSAAAMLKLAKQAPDAIDHKIARLIDGVDVTRDTHQTTTAVETMLRLFVKAPVDSGKTSLKIDQLLNRMSDTFGLSVDRLSRRLQTLRDEQRSRDQQRSRYQAKQSASKSSPKPTVQSNSDFDIDPFAQAAAEDAEMFGIEGGERNFSENFSGKPQAQNEPPTALSGIDRELFETLIESPEVAAMAVEAIDPDWLSSNTAKMLLSAYQDLDLEGRSLDTASLLTLLENEFLKNQIISLQDRVESRQKSPNTSALSEHGMDSPRERYTVILTRYREREFEAEKAREIARLQSALLPEDEELAVLERLFAAERIRQTPLR